MITTDRERVVDFALWYASIGLHVVPILEGEKRPAIDRWVERATADADLITQWWTTHPTHGVGICTGSRSGVFVLDVDPKHGGDDTLADLDHEHGPLPLTVRSLTPSGGEHIFFKMPDGWNPGTGAGKLGPGLDIRAEGGQVVSPPTDGRAWQHGMGFEEVDVADAPPWLLDLLRTPPPEPRRVVEAPADDDRPGTRWAKLTPWADLLSADGATHLATIPDRRTGHPYETWARPGVTDHAGASLYYGGTDVLKVFSSNWPGLTEGETYTKLGYLAATRHGGDFQAAAKWCEGQVPAPRLGTRVPEFNESTGTEAGDEAPPTRRYVPGGDFALDIPDVVPAVWGSGTEVLWAEGESLLVVGPPGVGKTTITHQVVLARCGIGHEVLGWPVTATKERLLYLACDRPAQIARSLHRMVNEEHRQILNDKLTIWRGPPPADFAKDPTLILRMATEVGADTVFIDSLKDVALGLVEDEVGAGYNRARQLALAEGVQLCELHHQRKGQNGTKPKGLEDVYGSVWLTAGAGSVLLLWGQGGEPLVELVHLKQPADQLQQGLQISHDHEAGVSTLVGAINTVVMVSNASGGLTARDVAYLMFKKEPAQSEVEKVRRKLDGYVKDGKMTREKDGKVVKYMAERGVSAAIHKVTRPHESSHADTSSIDLTDTSRTSRNDEKPQVNGPTRDHTHLTAPPPHENPSTSTGVSCDEPGGSTYERLMEV